ncbi:MAG: type I deoxyribonuclease HsdR [Pirellulaceae bacterium]|nr:MAG: type I deoxyribonuclease HsdR [Pirellulaceae bacterium]
MLPVPHNSIFTTAELPTCGPRSIAIRWVLSLGLLMFSVTAFAQHSASIDADDLLRREEEAFRRAAAAAQHVAVQIESFGSLQRVGEELVSDGPTTGTIVGEDGWIISTMHSFRGQPASILVTLADGRRLSARIVARDYSRELVLLKVDGVEGLPVARLSSLLDDRQSLVGRWAIALGKVYDPRTASQSVGIVSATGRAYGRALQTDAKISPINYGGPLVDVFGRVLGVLAPITPGPFVEGGADQLYDSGIGFAIPLDDILARLPRMKAGEDIHPGKLGIVTTNQNEMAGPVVVAGSMPGTPAGRVGLQAGDVIVAAEGLVIRRLADLQQALGPVDAGHPFRFTLWRRGNRIDLTAELAAEIPTYRKRLLGLWAGDAPEGGLRITQVEPGTPAAVAGLQVGDRLVELDGHRQLSRETLRRALAVAELDQELEFSVLRNKQDELMPVRVKPAEWPDELPRIMPPAIETAVAETRIVDIQLGDFPNHAYAIVPQKVDPPPLGLLIVFPEPGELPSESSEAYWRDFVTAYGWIVAVINSRNPHAWSLEELELAQRTLGRLQQHYSIDPARVVVGGLGIGGRLAVLAGLSARDRVAGVLLIDTDLGQFAPRQANMPMQSVDFLLVGGASTNASAVEALRAAGYSVIEVESTAGEQKDWRIVPAEPVQLWLAGLGRF